jgi:hypothetical protein
LLDVAFAGAGGEAEGEQGGGGRFVRVQAQGEIPEEERETPP